MVEGSGELCEQRLSLLEVSGVKPRSEPELALCQEPLSFCTPALDRLQPIQVYPRTQLQ
jgi:hypothetical protein